MIEFLSDWAEQIIVAVIIATIIEMILPNNNNKKYIKLVIGIYILFVIISPFIGNKETLNLNQIQGNTIKTTISEQKVNQESMDARLQELYIEQIQNDITNKVEEEGYIVKKCEADVELRTDAEDKGIKRIILKIDKNTNSTEDKNNNASTKKQIVNKIEIKVGLDKYTKKDDNETVNSSDINKLKSTLSEYYQVDLKKITITKD